MEEAIAKAGALIEAMEYIRRFRGRIVVVKLGGSVLDDVGLQKKLLTDVAFMDTVGIRPIIVHGGDGQMCGNKIWREKFLRVFSRKQELTVV